MKKLGILFAFIIMVFTMNVKALTEDGLKEKILQTIKVGNSEYKLTDGEKKILEDYLAENEISDADATYIGEKVDAAIAIIQAQGNTNFTSYPQSVKDDLKALVRDISNNTSIKASLTKEGLIVKNADGSTVIITKLVKQTGYNTNISMIIVITSIIVAVVGCGFVVKQVKASK